MDILSKTRGDAHETVMQFYAKALNAVKR